MQMKKNFYLAENFIDLFMPKRIKSEEKTTYRSVKSAFRAAFLSVTLSLVGPVVFAAAPKDTVYLSSRYITHIIFDSEITYTNNSNQELIEGAKLESGNKLALMATRPFEGTASFSVEESGGAFHTYIIKYREHPRDLVVDRRTGASRNVHHRIDTLSVSSLYTTHIIFATDISYAVFSDHVNMAGMIVKDGRNKFAITARNAFDTTASISLEEANGLFHTYILKYEEDPDLLVYDMRDARSGDAGTIVGRAKAAEGTAVSAARRDDAPLLSDVIKLRQGLFHLSDRAYDLVFTCENIFSYSDITYIVLSLENRSGVSYEMDNVQFITETPGHSKRKIKSEAKLSPKNRFGTLSAPPGTRSRVAFSFDKITLPKDQVLNILFFEKGGNRNVTLTLSSKDVNSAVQPEKKR